MNFLAHIYLSNNNSDIMLGNFIADHIKGKEMFHYNKGIQTGILLHRAIDDFTDSHPTVKLSKNRLHPRYRHYDGVIIDIFYDYFLAKHWSRYSNLPLGIFADYFYELLSNMPIKPKKTERFAEYMIRYNLLVNYRNLDTIAQVLTGMNHRSKLKSHMHLAIDDLKSMHSDFEADFLSFFEELIAFSHQKLVQIQSSTL